MIVEVEDEFMRDLILLVHVDVEAEDPDVEDEDGDSPPYREVAWELAVFVQTDVVDADYYD